MALRYYDDAVVAKLKRWIPSNMTLRVLKPDETKRFLETQADDKKDEPLALPLMSLSRNTDIELLQTTKCLKSFQGLAIHRTEDVTVEMNVIPVKLDYQLDLYTRTYEEGDNLLREFLFKLINNPKIIIGIPYNDIYVQATANIRVSSTVSDTSAVSERLFSGQFTRWTINFEIQDAHLYSLPYKDNWKIIFDDNTDSNGEAVLEVYNLSNFADLDSSEPLSVSIKK